MAILTDAIKYCFFGIVRLGTRSNALPINIVEEPKTDHEEPNTEHEWLCYLSGGRKIACTAVDGGTQDLNKII